MFRPQEPATLTSLTRRSALTAFAFTVSLLFLSILAVMVTVAYLNSPDPEFPGGTEIVIEEGLAQDEITREFEQANVVRSGLYLYLHLRKQYPDAFIQAGSYLFPKALSTREVARAIVEGDYRAPLLRLTFPEGFRARDLATYLPPEFEAPTTTSHFEAFEGTLFPDTYFVSDDTSLDEVLLLLRENYDQKMDPLREEIAASGMSEAEVITLASLVEREAKDEESKKIVAGVLHNRLELGMPLQVDAVFDYLFGKESAELTEDDLSVDSPFNTYRYAGLPPAPIANPGLESILAVLRPTTTAYLYYLTADDGTFHYAETFDEHVENKFRYLR